MTRPVSVFKWFRSKDAPYTEPFTKEFVGVGKFHQFGMDSEEVECGVSTFSTAIVEMPDGSVTNVAVDLMRFDDI